MRQSLVWPSPACTGFEEAFTGRSEDRDVVLGLGIEGEVPWVGFEPTLSVV